jgi:O-antigen/teichoic acid export membrane protein
MHSIGYTMGTCLVKDTVAFPQAPAKALSLQQNFAWTTVGNAAYSACQWALVCLLAKLGSPEIVGQYALGLAVTTPVLMLGQLNLRAVLATDVAEKHTVRDYCGLRLTVTVLSLMAIAAITYLAGYPLELSLVIIAVGIAQCVEGISDIYYGVLQLHERMERIAVSMIVRGLLSVAAIGIGLYFTRSVLYSIVALIVVRTLVLLLYDSRQALADLHVPSFYAQSGFEVHARNQLHIFRIALPLGVVLMLSALSSSTPRYFIEHHYGNRELGIFSAIASLPNVAKTFVNALGQSATPRLARLFAGQDMRRFTSLAAKLIGMGAALGIAGVLFSALFGKYVLAMVYKPEYAAYSSILVALMIAGTFDSMASLMGYSMTAARSFRSQIPLLLAVTGTTALVSLLLIPRRGLIGAAFAIGAGAIVQFSGSVLVLWRAVRVHSDER